MDATHSSRPFTLMAACLLGLVAVCHLARAFSGWAISIAGWSVPLWLSGAAGIALITLAIMVWREVGRR